MDTSPSSSEIIWDGLSDQETKEINKWLSLSKEEQINIYSEITEFWSSEEALPMPEFDPEVVRGMLAYYENANLKKYRDEMTIAGCEDPSGIYILPVVTSLWMKVKILLIMVNL
jgi:hypothetical protein